MRVAITGSTGLIGSALTRSLLADGHQVLRLTRGAAKAAADGSESAAWDPKAGTVQPGALEGVEAVVHLAGAGVGDKRWSDAYKKELRDSRVLGTQTIARAVAALDAKPRVLISSSAVGYYGDTGDRIVDESTPAGTDFLAGLCVEWEDAAAVAAQAGIRVVHPRTGLVVSAEGGAWGKLFPLFRAGLGGRLGSGDQYWPFIALADQIAGLRFAIDNEDVVGPLNFSAPEPLTNREITKAMGRALNRPTLAPVPGFALKIAVGEFAAGITGSCRAVPAGLLKAGFAFRFPTIEQSLQAAIHPSA
ncbi:MAG TPA: TIGR01777 family oxidoreductase [Actinospica sp.]|nr:TIGR01777 family oxidoreductase [Actinospica sp.]